MIPIYAKITGNAGVAEPVEPPDTLFDQEAVSAWLITGAKGFFHPIFDQWLLLAVRLRDGVPGFPPPHRQFDGATHEILCLTLNADQGRYDTDRIKEQWGKDQVVSWIEPPNVIVQVEATDDEVTPILSLLAQSVVHGLLVPESLWTAGFDENLNLTWTAAITKTLAHGRGEVHAP